MKITARQIYRWSRFALILSIIVFTICMLIAMIAAPEYMGLYWTATYQARIVLFVIPVAAIICAVSGFPLIRQRKSSHKSGAETHLWRIMQRLTPDERTYLQNELDQRLVGMGDDGEIMSLNELKQSSKESYE